MISFGKLAFRVQVRIGPPDGGLVVLDEEIKCYRPCNIVNHGGARTKHETHRLHMLSIVFSIVVANFFEHLIDPTLAEGFLLPCQFPRGTLTLIGGTC